MANLNLKNIKKSFEKVDVIRGIDLDVLDGEFTVFVGPSGCGKSTLLRVIAGLEDATSGEILIDGEVMNDVDASKRGLSMVFQSYALYPHMSVRENMAFGLKLSKLPAAEIDKRINDAAEILKITHLLDRLPKTLSGGQRQRVAIGRSIVREPKIFLFDEPLSNLDAELRVQMRLELAKLHERLSATMIYVTHDQVEAMTLADKIVVLNGGHIEQVGSPLELYNNPVNVFVAGFIGSPQMNFIDVSVSDTQNGMPVVTLPGGASLNVPVEAADLKPGDTVKLGIRPEHLHLSSGPGADIPGKIILSEQLGSETYLHAVISSGATLVIQSPGQVLLKSGDKVSFELDAAHTHLFRADGAAFKRQVTHAVAVA